MYEKRINHTLYLYCARYIRLRSGPGRLDDLQGELVGIGIHDVHGMIDYEPNEGHMGTPVTITLTFDRNADLVQEIRTWQAYERSSWEFERTPDIDPQKEDNARWTVWRNLFLSGESGIVRFYAINNNERIGFGDIEINGGKPD